MLEKIKVIISDTLDQNNLFTPYHRKYKVTIKYNGKQYTTTYQCNARQTPSPKDIIYCLLLDANCYDTTRDIKDFAEELGYELYEYDYGCKYNKETERVYKACRKTSDAMHLLFTEEELETLYKEVEDN